jgi:hypothetical protein
MPSASGKPRYLACLPWIGPILDATLVPDRPLRVGAAADPLLGEACAVALLPVPADPASGWIAAPKSDGSGRFRVKVPVMLWSGAVAGLLMVLLYDRKTNPDGRRFPKGWESVSALPQDVRTDVQEALASLLRQPFEELQPGLIEPGGSQPSELTFAVASCQYPAGFLDGDPAEAACRRLSDLLDRDGKPGALQCLLLLGDQVYLDATAGLFDPTAQHDRFDLPYERMLRMKPLRQVLRRVPAYMMLDDHEIEDNWEPVAGSDGSERNLVEGRSAYLRYQRLAGPELLPALGDSSLPLWYDFMVGEFPFFMADTRSERRPRSAETIDQARIMSKSQFRSLRRWLARQEKRAGDIPKFIASPACFLPRHRRAAQNRHPASALRSDGWDGYPRTFFPLLAYIAQKGIRNVIFLSGDEHISFATSAEITDQRSGKVARIHSIHSSGLYSPFPFANSVYDSLFCNEEFEFSHYRCKLVPLDVAPGDGFALLRVRRENGKWLLGWLFDRAAAPRQETWIPLT